MSIYKRGNVYWAHFGYDGEDFRVSLGTSDWQEAKRLEKQEIAKAESGKIRRTDSFARLPFHLCWRDGRDEPACPGCGKELEPLQDEELRAEISVAGALEQYRRDRKPYLAATTVRSELDHSNPLAKFFGETRVNKITDGMIRDFISERHQAGRLNATMNKELGILIGILKRAKRWHLFSEEIKRLRVVKSKIGRVLGDDEKLRLLRVSKAKPGWQRARLAMLLALNTTMRSGEIRGLQWRDVNWIERSIQIRRGKTEESQREIPLNREARLRFHDLRHQAITELSEGLASDETIMSIAGHIDRRMMSHYSHIRRLARRAAVEQLSRSRRAAASVDIAQDAAQSTAQLRTFDPVHVSQVFERNGGDDETRTRDLCRDRAAF